MKYIVIVIVILGFYAIEGFALNFLVQDTLLIGESTTGNRTSIQIDTQNVNMSVLSASEGKTSLRSFIEALKIMFTFRTPSVDAMPTFLVSVISFINWVGVIIGGVSVYRILNPLA